MPNCVEPVLRAASSVAVHASVVVMSTLEQLAVDVEDPRDRVAIDAHRERRRADRRRAVERAEVGERLRRRIELRERVVLVDDVDQLRRVGAAASAGDRAVHPAAAAATPPPPPGPPGMRPDGPQAMNASEARSDGRHEPGTHRREPIIGRAARSLKSVDGAIRGTRCATCASPRNPARWRAEQAARAPRYAGPNGDAGVCSDRAARAAPRASSPHPRADHHGVRRPSRRARARRARVPLPRWGRVSPPQRLRRRPRARGPAPARRDRAAGVRRQSDHVDPHQPRMATAGRTCRRPAPTRCSSSATRRCSGSASRRTRRSRRSSRRCCTAPWSTPACRPTAPREYRAVIAEQLAKRHAQDGRPDREHRRTISSRPSARTRTGTRCGTAGPCARRPRRASVTAFPGRALAVLASRTRSSRCAAGGTATTCSTPMDSRPRARGTTSSRPAPGSSSRSARRPRAAKQHDAQLATDRGGPAQLRERDRRRHPQRARPARGLRRQELAAHRRGAREPGRHRQRGRSVRRGRPAGRGHRRRDPRRRRGARPAARRADRVGEGAPRQGREGRARRSSPTRDQLHGKLTELDAERLQAALQPPLADYLRDVNALVTHAGARLVVGASCRSTCRSRRPSGRSTATRRST